MATRTLFIIGAGGRVGKSIAKKFQAEGYHVAVGSRNPGSKDWSDVKALPVTVEAGDINSIQAAFATVTEKIGKPNVVVFNAAAFTFPKDPQNPFGIAPEDFRRDLSVNATGNYTAIHEFLNSWKDGGNDSPKVFISTGNILPWKPWPLGVTLGSGEAARAHTVDLASRLYKQEEFKFYFASQIVLKDGEHVTVPNPELNGAAHAEVYWNLVNEKEGRNFNVQFTADNKIVS